MNENKDYLFENMALLYQIHGGKVVVIRKQSVLGVYDNIKKAKKAAKNIDEAEIYSIENILKN